MAVNLQRGGERERERAGETQEADDKNRDSVQCLSTVWHIVSQVCSIGLSSNGLSLYINVTPVNLRYSKFTEHS